MSSPRFLIRCLQRSVMVAPLIASIVGCHSSPATQGAHYRLPAAPDRILVVGNRSSVVSAAVSWLQNRSVTALEMPSTLPLADPQEMTVLAQKLGANVIVWVEQMGDLRAPTVSVRGIEAGSNVVLWSGQASATDYRSSPVGTRVISLTCHALSAAWGEHPDAAGCT